MSDDQRLHIHIHAREEIADGVVKLVLKADNGALPPFTPGSHLDLHLPNGMVRSYSLLNEHSANQYEVAVGRDPSGRGGSSYIYDTLKAGDRLRASAPRNNFPLSDTSARSVLIAGGIGITPIFAMVTHLHRRGRPWQLHYSVRSRKRAALLAELDTLHAQGTGRLTLHVDEEAGGAFLDIAALVRSADADAHFYCCGPTPMLDAFVSATSGLPAERVHLERFSADSAPATAGGFVVELARTGLTVNIEPGRGILETLLEAGVDVAFSCQQGTCGSCETKVLDGIPDHRDAFLTDDERESNSMMMICCSGSKTAKLVLDL